MRSADDMTPPTTGNASGRRRRGQLMSWDAEAVRKDLSARQSDFVHLDGPGGTQTPEKVASAGARTCPRKTPRIVAPVSCEP